MTHGGTSPTNRLEADPEGSKGVSALAAAPVYDSFGRNDHLGGLQNLKAQTLVIRNNMNQSLKPKIKIALKPDLLAADHLQSSYRIRNPKARSQATNYDLMSTNVYKNRHSPPVLNNGALRAK